MDNFNDFNKQIANSVENISLQVDILIPIYLELFNIEKIFNSENGGKTRINRQFFSKNHWQVKNSIEIINLQIDDILIQVRQKMTEILIKVRDANSISWLNLVFDDIKFLESFKMEVNSANLQANVKQKVIKDIEEIIAIKNRVFNWGYYIDIFDTTILDKHINHLGVEDLINSTIIFEIIDSYALQFESLKKFAYEIKNLNNLNEKITSLNSLSYLMELHKRKMNNFTYANIKYKIFIDYSFDVTLLKPIDLNIAYLENILSCIIEQSCLDIVKKELKKGKIQKYIDVEITSSKNILKIIVRNNGYEVRNIESLYASDMENKYILEARNLANSINAKLDIAAGENNEGMKYSVALKLK